MSIELDYTTVHGLYIELSQLLPGVRTPAQQKIANRLAKLRSLMEGARQPNAEDWEYIIRQLTELERSI